MNLNFMAMAMAMAKVAQMVGEDFDVSNFYGKPLAISCTDGLE